MDTLDGFLRNNDATLIIPLLPRLKISTDAQVYLPDDVAIRFLANHLNIPLNDVFYSSKFIQMLQYGINPQGFVFSEDEEGRKTIDGLAVLATIKTGRGALYNVIDGVLGKDNDLKELANIQIWIKLPNDVFRNVVRINHIKGKELLFLCSSNRALSAKCDSSNGALFRELLFAEFGIRLEACVSARAKYLQIYYNYDVLKVMLEKIDLWRQMSVGELDEWFMPDDIYDLRLLSL